LGLRIGVYLQVALALVFFRGGSLGGAFAMLGDLFGRHGLGHVGNLLDGLPGFAMFPVVWFLPNTQQILGEEPSGAAAPSTLLDRLRWSPNVAWGLAMAVLFFATLTFLGDTSSFLYFQF
jgi:hypothetical protein